MTFFRRHLFQPASTVTPDRAPRPVREMWHRGGERPASGTRLCHADRFLLEVLCTSPATCQPDRPPAPGAATPPLPPRAGAQGPPAPSPTAARVTSRPARAARPGPRGWIRPVGLTSPGASLPPAWSAGPGAGRPASGGECQGREAPYLSSRPHPPCTGPTSCRALNPTCSPPAAPTFLKVGPRAPTPDKSRESRPRVPGPEGRRRPDRYREMIWKLPPFPVFFFFSWSSG